MATLNLDIPQLPVMENPSYSHVTIRFANAADDGWFLYSYLSFKMAECAVAHDILNEELRKIYISYFERKDLQVEYGAYKLDNHHYAQLIRTNQVTRTLADILFELMFCIYFMKQLKHQVHPTKRPLKDVIDWVLHHEELSVELAAHLDFVKKCETILAEYQRMTIRPAYDYFMMEVEPVYFITGKNGKMSRYFLGKLIEEYTAFFSTAKKLLKTHAPEAVALDIRVEPND